MIIAPTLRLLKWLAVLISVSINSFLRSSVVMNCLFCLPEDFEYPRPFGPKISPTNPYKVTNNNITRVTIKPILSPIIKHMANRIRIEAYKIVIVFERK